MPDACQKGVVLKPRVTDALTPMFAGVLRPLLGAKTDRVFDDTWAGLAVARSSAARGRGNPSWDGTQRHRDVWCRHRTLGRWRVSMIGASADHRLALVIVISSHVAS